MQSNPIHDSSQADARTSGTRYADCESAALRFDIVQDIDDEPSARVRACIDWNSWLGAECSLEL